jgi:putative transposase
MEAVTKPNWHDRGYLPHFDPICAIQHVVLSGIKGVDLSRPELASLIQAAILHFDRERYCLQAWCIMPDHVHICLIFAPSQLMGATIRSWKSWITRQWQKRAGAGSKVFATDYFDRHSRDLNQANRLVGYIEDNAVSAGLVLDASEWRWSSAWHKARGWEPFKEWLPVFLPSGSR